MTRTTVAICGASGYAGGEAIRLVAGHPDLEIGPLLAGTKAGSSLATVHPALAALGSIELLAGDSDEVLGADAVLMALPHGQSAALAARLRPEQIVVDLGADFRLGSDADWTKYYGGTRAGQWTYGLPELPGAREAIARATRVANPGCYATAMAIALAPLCGAELIDPQAIVVVAASGTSGAGRTPSEALLATEVMGSMSPYKVGGVHQHTPEVEQTLGAIAGRPVTLSFTPLLAPMPRGIVATCSAPISSPGVTLERVAEAFRKAYESEPFVRLLEAGRWPSTAAVLGSNAVEVQFALDEHAGRVVVVVTLDNLGKGAAGQAIQNLNLMLGLPETAGLSNLGVSP